MKKHQWLALLLTVAMIVSLTGCGNKKAPTPDNATQTQRITVRYLNFKPEIAPVYEKIAESYQQETGNTVIIETAANNTYEQTLSSKMATSEAPTIFQINGPRGYNNWKRYCADLSDSKLAKHLTDPSLALTVDGKTYGIPYVVEGYGILCNTEIFSRYFALPDKTTPYNSLDDIHNFESLKAVTEDMQSHKDVLGIRGVFAATSLKPGEDWRWQTHLANIPIYYEFEEKNIDLTGDDTKSIDFLYADQYRRIFDLYIHNSTTDPKVLGTKLVDESMAEFATGQCAMVQNGNWAWNQIRGMDGIVVSENNLRFLPIYMGNEQEEQQGLCIGTENFLCINDSASPEEKAAAEEFLYWLFSSDTGKRYVIDELGFIAPFDTFSEDEEPEDPLAKEILRYMKDDSVNNIPWNFTLFPSQTFKDDFGTALLQYAQGKLSFDEVKQTVIDRWKEESALL